MRVLASPSGRPPVIVSHIPGWRESSYLFLADLHAASSQTVASLNRLREKPHRTHDNQQHRQMQYLINRLPQGWVIFVVFISAGDHVSDEGWCNVCPRRCGAQATGKTSALVPDGVRMVTRRCVALALNADVLECTLLRASEIANGRRTGRGRNRETNPSQKNSSLHEGSSSPRRRCPG
eukprot:3908983-Rhodomonas_salina.2